MRNLCEIRTGQGPQSPQPSSQNERSLIKTQPPEALPLVAASQTTDQARTSVESNSNGTEQRLFSHKSTGTESFLSCCQKKLIDCKDSSSALFHLCRIGDNVSIRKPSLRTQSQSEISVASRTVNESPISQLDEDIFDCPFERNGIDSLSEVNHPNTNSSPKMGCCCSSGRGQQVKPMGGDLARQASSGNGSLDEEDSDDNQRNPETGAADVGLKAASKADLLETQRLAPTDVTRGLENRWLRSHFVKPSDENGAAATAEKDSRPGKRRKGGNRTTLSSSELDEAPSTGHENLLTGSGKALPQGVRNRLSILHFNDVYEISERTKEPVGGAARFAEAMRREAERLTRETGVRPLVLFGGDCLNPSTLSCATQGAHMVKVLNKIKVDVAVFGNHEFDFGVEHAVKCISEMDSTWLLSNVVDQLTKRNLVEGKTKLIKEHNGMKIGFLGLVEEEWLETLATVDKSDLDFSDYVTRGREIAAELREEGAEFVIALTHMRWPNDTRLAKEVPDIDLILGGHDHEYGVKEIDECLVVKSGADFRNFSTVDVFMRDDECVDVRLTRHDVTRAIPEDPEMADIVQTYMQALERGLDRKIGEIKADLDGTFKSVRTKETRLGNFVADIMAAVTRSDMVLINSGTFRSDDIHRSGDFRLDDLMKILPINDTVVIIEVTGKQLLKALENGVCKYPKREGRFPQVSNMCFGFNPSNPPGQRVLAETVRVGGAPVEPDRVYNMATKAYVARGKDGYDCLKNCKIKTDPDSGPLLSTVVRNHIKNVFRLLEFEKAGSCEIRVSPDGRTLTSSDGADPYRAFTGEAPDEEPITMIKKSMKPVLDANNNKAAKKGGGATASKSQAMHTPNFITFPRKRNAADSADDHKLALLREELLKMHALDDLALLREREASPELLKWQVQPLLEARVFHCKDFSR